MADYDLNYFEPNFLAGAIEKVVPLKTFFKRWFGEVKTYGNERVSFEFRQGRYNLAPYADQRVGGDELARAGYDVRTFTFPFVSAMRSVTPDTARLKLFGETPVNSGETVETRAAKIIAEDLQDLEESIARREEQMCAEVKQTGKLKVKIKGETVQEIDYGFKNLVDVSASDKWTETSDILGQLESLAHSLRRDGINPNMLILGAKAAKVLINNEKVLKLLDNRRVELGQLKLDALEDGVNYLGHLGYVGASFDLYTYESYIPDEASSDGRLKPAMPDDMVIMQSSGERNIMAYGPIITADANGVPITQRRRQIVDTWGEHNPPQHFMSISTRPLPIPRDITSWLVLRGAVA